MKVKVTKHHDGTRGINIDNLDETTYRRIQRVFAHAARGIAYDGGQTRITATLIDNIITPENAKKPGMVISPVMEPSPVVYVDTPKSIPDVWVTQGVYVTNTGVTYPVMPVETTTISQSMADITPQWDSALINNSDWCVGMVLKDGNNYFLIKGKLDWFDTGKSSPEWKMLLVTPHVEKSAVPTFQEYLKTHSSWSTGKDGCQVGDRVWYKGLTKSEAAIMVYQDDHLWHWEEDGSVVSD